MWGPCFGHKRAIFWPFLGKGDYGIHPELWNLAWSIPGHFDYDSGRTNLEDHILTIKGPFLGKGTIEYTQQCEIWHWTSLGTLIKIKEEPIWRTMWGPCFGHKRAIFWSFLGKGDYWIHHKLWYFALIPPGHVDYYSERTSLKDQIRTIFWP